VLWSEAQIEDRDPAYHVGMREHRQYRFSLIIPAYNEEGYLPRLLDTVDTARATYRGGVDSIEVIVGDNASTDSTADIARQRGCVVAQVTERCIASVRNGGAALARGDVLAFVDADMRIHPETFNAIEDRLDTGKVVAGATGVRLERWSLGIAATYAAMVPWVWLLRMDTGVVFCSVEDFHAIGGYDERRYFGEDVQLLVDLRRLGRERGQRLARVRSAKALGSMRKFDHYGDWHYFTMIFGLVPALFRPPETIDDRIREYWYGDGERGSEEP
jgi:glycosyltransferase involved in cell wall biosynthesis